MYDTIRIFIRFISVCLLFSIALDIPTNIYWLYHLYPGYSFPIIITALGKFLYYLTLAFVVWRISPGLAKKICDRYLKDKNNQFDITLATRAMLRAGLLLLGAKYFFEKSLVLINYIFVGVFNLNNANYEYKNLQNRSLLEIFVNPTTISALLSIVVIVAFFIYYKKIEEFLIK